MGNHGSAIGRWGREVGEAWGDQRLCSCCFWQQSFGQRDSRHEEENWPYQPQGSLFSWLQEKKEILEIIYWDLGQGGVLWYFLKELCALPALFPHQVRVKQRQASAECLLSKAELVAAGSVARIRQLREGSAGLPRNLCPQGGQGCLDVLLTPW